ncbi:MAG: hypothetical protein RLZZ602_2270, partial [Pseudomonadota bacterium]
INPCGYTGLEVVSMASLLGSAGVEMVPIGERLLSALEVSLST